MWGNRVKGPLILQLSPTVTSLRQGNVSISSFLPCPDGQGPEQRDFSLTDRQRGRILWSRPLPMIITKTTKSKSKREFQHGVRIGFSPQHPYSWVHLGDLRQGLHFWLTGRDFPDLLSGLEGGGEKEGIISEEQTAVKETLQEVYHLHYTKSLLLGVCSFSI